MVTEIIDISGCKHRIVFKEVEFVNYEDDKGEITFKHKSKKNIKVTREIAEQFERDFINNSEYL